MEIAAAAEANLRKLKRKMNTSFGNIEESSVELRDARIGRYDPEGELLRM